MYKAIGGWRWESEKMGVTVSCGLNRMKHDFFKKNKNYRKIPSSRIKYIKIHDASYKKIHTRTQIRYTNNYIYLSIKTSIYYMFRPQQIKYFLNKLHITLAFHFPSFFNPYEVSFPYPFFHLYQNAYCFDWWKFHHFSP